MQHLARLEMEKGHLAGQLTEMKGKCTKSNTENVALTAQLNKLQQQLGQQAEQQLRNGQQSWGVQQGPSTPSQTPRRNSPAQNPFMVFK